MDAQKAHSQKSVPRYIYNNIDYKKSLCGGLSSIFINHIYYKKVYVYIIFITKSHYIEDSRVDATTTDSVSPVSGSRKSIEFLPSFIASSFSAFAYFFLTGK